LLSSIDDLRSEARSASDRLNVLTWALVIATVALLIVGVITLVKVW
jgi:midasin (ATPase involved in ribosome maturation)